TPQTPNLHPTPPPPRPRRRREPGNVCTGSCSAAEHRSLFSEHHACSHMTEDRLINDPGCQTQQVFHL
ncbi:hypothetical protein NDU88_008105, partial [Pleurodeles waltl]